MATTSRDCCIFCGTDTNISTRIENEKWRSLHAISILHKILQIPIYECGKYLDFSSSSSSGGTDWLILCVTCSCLAAQGHDLALQIDLLHAQLVKIQTTLQNQIVDPRKRNNFMAKASAKIVDQLKQDISQRRDPDNTKHRPIAKNMFSDAVNAEGSIDDMNLSILAEDVKIEYPETNSDDDYDLNIDPLTMEIDPADSNGSEDDGSETNLSDDNEVKNVRKPRKAKVTQKKRTRKPTAKTPTQTRIKEYNPNVDFSTASIEVVETSQHKPKLKVNGYAYNLEKFGTNKRIWICERQRREKCNARLHTTYSLSPVEILGELRTHNHGPCPSFRKKKPTKIRDESSTTEFPASESSKTAIDSTSS